MSRGILQNCSRVDNHGIIGVGMTQVRNYTNLQEEKLKQLRDRIIRVDHAGEFGANRIYEGQLAVLSKHNVK